VTALLGLGLVVTASPLTVRLNGDTQATPAKALSDFTGATSSTEVLIFTAETARYAQRVWN
jgi:hypothetical protein